MDLSIFLAKAWGLYLVIISLAFLFNIDNLKKILHYYRDEEVPFFSGFFVLLIGLLSVLSHNIWTYDWRVLVTLLGWTALLKGAVRLFSPELVVEVSKKYNKTHVIPWLYISLILGLFLTVRGFIG